MAGRGRRPGCRPAARQFTERICRRAIALTRCPRSFVSAQPSSWRTSWARPQRSLSPRPAHETRGRLRAGPTEGPAVTAKLSRHEIDLDDPGFVGLGLNVRLNIAGETLRFNRQHPTSRSRLHLPYIVTTEFIGRASVERRNTGHGARVSKCDRCARHWTPTRISNHSDCRIPVEVAAWVPVCCCHGFLKTEEQ
jgi:hypothetical protein